MDLCSSRSCWMAASSSIVTNYVVPAQGTYVHKHTHTQAHKNQALDRPYPSTAPSHWVIFTQALSPLIGADEGLIGSFFYNTHYLSNGKLREATWAELMRSFRQIKASKLAHFTEQGERESWEYLLCPLHLSLMCRYLKRRGSGKGCTVVAEMLSTCTHKGICPVLFGGPSFSVLVMKEGCSSNECGKDCSGQ